MNSFGVMIFSIFILFSVVSSTELRTVVSSTEQSTGTQSFIVRVQNELKPLVLLSVERWYQNILSGITAQSVEEIKLLNAYKTLFHGFSVRLTQQQAKELEKHPSVLTIIPDSIHQIHTTRTPHFLGLDNIRNGNTDDTVSESNAGSDIIIGIIDYGIWPERQSFHDKGLGPIPSRWKGECMEGEEFPKTLCNRKIIGARYFTNGFVVGQDIIRSGRDSNGHGTHTASTAAGRHVANASFLGFSSGAAVGIAPKARLAIYKVCWIDQCLESDMLAGMDKAAEDGVDIISISLGGKKGVPYYRSSIAIASFAAMEKGIFVSAAAGNSGLDEMTVTNFAPWFISVGASIIDRAFPADLVLGNGTVITGASLYSGKPLSRNPNLSLIYVGYCNGPPDFNRLNGKIVLCDVNQDVSMEFVKSSGGAGVVIPNFSPEDEGSRPIAHLIPGMLITQSSGVEVQRYINSTNKPTSDDHCPWHPNWGETSTCRGLLLI